METRRVRRDGLSPERRDVVYGRGTRLRGVDLVEQIAANTTIQKQRWIDIYYRLCERKAKVDIAETVVVVDGSPCDWFFTSATTGEIQRKPMNHLNALTIKKHFVRASDAAAVTRQIALLVHEDAAGDMAYSLLSDLDFNLALCQAASPLWAASFLLQPFLPLSRQHAQCTGTFVATFNRATTTSSMRVCHTDAYFHGLKRADHTATTTTTATGASSRRPASAPASRTNKPTLKPTLAPRGVEQLIRAETGKLVVEIEAATQDAVRQLHAEFQVTRTHRLVLVRVARIVYASDLTRTSRGGGAKSPSRGRRPTSTGASTTANKQCTGGRFCHCTAFPTGEMTMTSTAPQSLQLNDFQHITRKSLQLCHEESQFLDAFGAHREAHLLEESLGPLPHGASLEAAALTTASDACESFQRVLQRRLCMLRSTVWNPHSDAFNAHPLAWQDEHAKQPQQYDMVRVCRPCYLIYHTMDAARFQATKATVKAAARRLTMLYNAKTLGDKRTAWHAHD